MADFAVWASAAEVGFGWEPGAFMEAYAGNRREATESALDIDPVAAAVREFMQDRQRWTGTATGLWKELSRRVDEDVRHTRAWPAAPNSLANRLKRLAPVLRGVDIEYGEDRAGSKGVRLKTLTKKESAKDRQSRQDRQHSDKGTQKAGGASDSSGSLTDDSDDSHAQHRQSEIPAKDGVPDSYDSRYEDFSKEANAPTPEEVR